jgi:hypothetical protein
MSLATPYAPTHTGSVWWGEIVYPHPETGESRVWESDRFDNYADACEATNAEWDANHKADAEENRDAYDVCVWEQMPVVRRK